MPPGGASLDKLYVHDLRPFESEPATGCASAPACLYRRCSAPAARAGQIQVGVDAWPSPRSSGRRRQISAAAQLDIAGGKLRIAIWILALASSSSPVAFDRADHPQIAVDARVLLFLHRAHRLAPPSAEKAQQPVRGRQAARCRQRDRNRCPTAPGRTEERQRTHGQAHALDVRSLVFDLAAQTPGSAAYRPAWRSSALESGGGRVRAPPRPCATSACPSRHRRMHNAPAQLVASHRQRHDGGKERSGAPATALRLTGEGVDRGA